MQSSDQNPSSFTFDPLQEFARFAECAHKSVLAPWADALMNALQHHFQPDQHGDFARWQQCVEALPTINVNQRDFSTDTVTVGAPQDCDEATRQQIETALRGLHPWRKGPFNVCGVEIDTEWRSDWKWQRLQPHIQSLKGRTVLDIGCGSGYHLWRMLGAGAALTIGIDPSLLFTRQFRAIEHFAGLHPVFHLPLGIEELPTGMRAFDTVFSMGVLYHRRSPLDHLLELRELLRPGGELILETLIVDGPEGYALVPDGRYGRMGNVWFLPSVPTLLAWLKKMRFRNVRCVDVTPTTAAEQRATGWMTYQSLPDFLDPNDSSKTVEGYPGPVRAIVLAEAP
ncbi:MAG TPA: tRNA 5-methoxyuridine(34)/uridine 5-oxyacetic acid(34) synthase CmoB [Dongiaceae bacterium]|nr:tRNA 5-methoxyuridine(34)/uridine 5-oxyacetic acid(34) synthase CmoB [Dongiaceae bacterium]